MLADSLAGIVAQQLLRRADGEGRIAVHEILVSNMGVASAIRESKTSMLSSLMQAGAREGMQTMDACLQKLLQAKVVTAADAMEKALDKESFARLPEVREALSAEGTLLE